MQAIQFDNNSKTLMFKENICIPKIENDKDVLIKVVYSGVCGTDLHIIDGIFPVQENFPVILGHEFCGEIVEIGKDVTSVKVGDRVVVDPNKGCGVCRFCQEGHPNYCVPGYEANTLGIYRNGGWANYCVAPVDQVTKIPPSITLEQAVLCEPLSCISHGYNLVCPIGNKILVQGCGIIGNLWISMLHSKSYKNVTVIEPNANRLKIAEQIGIGYKFMDPDTLKCEMLLNSTPFDFIVDCSGNGPAIEKSMTWLNKGGKYCMFGVPPPSVTISVKPFDIFVNEISIYGVKTNPYSFPKALNLIESLGSRYLNFDHLGIRVCTLDNFVCGFQQLRKGLVSKVVFKME